jgi:hypothetical protein
MKLKPGDTVRVVGERGSAKIRAIQEKYCQRTS